MKITDAKTFVVANPPPSFGGRYWVFLRLVTDSGIVGYGEAYSLPFHPVVVAGMIEDVCARHVINADPFRIEQLWRVIYSAGYSQRSGTALMGVLSAIEMACWDIVGKELDRPIYDLLGGRVRERIRSRPSGQPNMLLAGLLQSSSIRSVRTLLMILASCPARCCRDRKRLSGKFARQ
mgnify:CR=1 FL=1